MKHDVHRLNVLVVVQRFLAEFSTDTGLLEATKWNGVVEPNGFKSAQKPGEA